MGALIVDPRDSAVRPEVAPDAGSQVMAIIARAASDSSFDVEKMKALLGMHQQIAAQQAEMSFSRAMRNCQMEMLPVVRDAENAHTKSRYARLETIDAKIRPIYTKHGFSLTFNSPEGSKGNLAISCKAMHVDGHSENYRLEGELDGAGAQGKANKTGIQALGSSSTYLRRYLTLMIFNIVLTNEDNDGNGAVGFIDDEQQMKIEDLIAECKMTPEVRKKFLVFMNVASIAEIHKSQFDKATRNLNNIIESRKAAK